MCSLQLPGFLTMAMLAGEFWELTSIQLNLSKLRTLGSRNWSPVPLRVSDWGDVWLHAEICGFGRDQKSVWVLLFFLKKSLPEFKIIMRPIIRSIINKTNYKTAPSCGACHSTRHVPVLLKAQRTCSWIGEKHCKRFSVIYSLRDAIYQTKCFLVPFSFS